MITRNAIIVKRYYLVFKSLPGPEAELWRTGREDGNVRCEIALLNFCPQFFKGK